MNVWFGIAKRYYDMGLYTVENVKMFVKAGYISIEEFEQITGEKYVA
ncbi:hypothetical protein EUAN_06760 [Andreesenia angusta]|uniref:XkdX family protein n=1 Tax=Andreesenia angusta TaxID=39480 RepID=A0A1S1V8H4_9FIRM|nr:XkdX family protein [Andreesenia angusta]OHW62892.1 hypothetical protein EUAN_06760 [Andreesenia angusta]